MTNVPTISKYLEMTCRSELRKWNDEIVLKEKQDMCINIDEIQETIMFVVSKKRTHK